MKKRVIVGIAIICMAISVGVFIKIKSTKYEPVDASMNLATIQDGTYEGAYESKLVKVEVAVEVKDQQVKQIEILKHDCGLGKKAESIVETIIEKQTLQVDGVSGATMSSNAIKLAIEGALK